MFLNYLNFLRFLNYLKNYQCNEYPYYESITNISSDKNYSSLVKSNQLMLNFENIRNNVFSNQKIKPSTVDGLYFNFDKKHSVLSLYFVEFKGTDLSNKLFNDLFDKKIANIIDEQCDSPVDSCPINDLNKKTLKKVSDLYTNKISTNLKLKPFESLFVVFPKICEEYAKNNHLDFSIGDYYSFILTHINCHIIIVYKSGKNYINDAKTFAEDIKDKYRVLQNNNIITGFRVYDEVDFEENLLQDISEFPISFLDIIIPTIENVIQESQNPKEFGNLINMSLYNILNESNIEVNEDQKEKIRKIVSKCCMEHVKNN